MTIQALKDNLIVKPLYKKTEGSIIIPDSAVKHKQYDMSAYGLVVSVGKEYKYEIKAGDVIAFQKHEGKRFTYEGETYLMMKSRWVHGKVS